MVVDFLEFWMEIGGSFTGLAWSHQVRWSSLCSNTPTGIDSRPLQNLGGSPERPLYRWHDKVIFLSLDLFLPQLNNGDVEIGSLSSWGKMFCSSFQLKFEEKGIALKPGHCRHFLLWHQLVVEAWKTPFCYTMLFCYCWTLENVPTIL